jgi:hypothetical protein
MTSQQRKAIPKAVRDAVLAEYRHRCAICASDRPQLHHIDEDRTNNDPANLIPLCPNCHLTDQHDPTAPVDHDRMRLFRRFKDPAILSEQFVPLWRRCTFIVRAESTPGQVLSDAAEELCAFVQELEKGAFYANRLKELVGPFAHPHVWLLNDMTSRDFQRIRHEDAELDRTRILNSRDEALGLVVELLRYQEWKIGKR